MRISAWIDLNVKMIEETVSPKKRSENIRVKK